MTMQDPKDLDGSPLELLIKVMKMTSAEDNIALVAIRKANAHLDKLGTDWESVLRSKVKIIADPFASMNIPTDAMNNLNRNQDYKPQAPAHPAPPPPPPKRQPYTPPPAYNPPPRGPAPAVKPKPGSPQFTGDVLEKTIVNKFEGTCTKCKNRVNIGDGIAKLWSRPSGINTYWTTEHSGTCPPTRKFRPVTTADDFQV